MKAMLAIAVLSLLVLAGCKSYPESVVGAWQMQPSAEWLASAAKSGSAPPAGEFVFNADGTCRMTRAADSSRMDMKGTYVVQGDKVIINVMEINGQLSPNSKGLVQTGTLTDGRGRFNINGLSFVR